MANNTGTWLAEQLMRDFGLTPGAAAGFAGNLAHESGNFKTLQEINPTVKGSRGGFGWAQWTGPRRRQFESYTEQNRLDPTSREANYGFLKHELSETPEGGILGALQGVNDPAKAAQIVSNKFLRPGIPHMSSRINKANEIAGSLGSQIASQEAFPPQASGTPAPPMPAPMNVAAAPATPAQATPPPGLFASLGGQGGAGGMDGILQMLMSSGQTEQQQPMQLAPMPQRPQNQMGLSDYIQQFLSHTA